MESIKLNDLLRLDDKTLERTKIRLFCVPSNNKDNDPLEKYEKDPSEITERWFLWKNKNNAFKVGQLGLGLLELGYDKWLFVTAKEIDKKLPLSEPGIGYKATVVSEYSKYFGRVVIKYDRSAQQTTYKAETFIEKLEVLEILPTSYDGENFPGYENVTITWKQLNAIIERQKKDWVTALKNQKGVYLITDQKTGKQYVGSAYGAEMLLQRWTDYSNTGHGGNKRLIELGFDYIQENFQYSILETYNNNVPDDLIPRREAWWKKALKTKEFGLNEN
jgi:hypothetical protein